MATVKVDPLTRIEGHLKIETNVGGGIVNSAKVSGTMARGIEKLLKGRDPRDATLITERICGVCFSAHGLTSSIAVEKAQGTTNLPNAARLIRNLITGACWLHDHPLHFYHLAGIDYFDLSVMASYNGTDTYLNKIKDKIIAETASPPVEGEFIGPFLPTYKADSLSIKDLDRVVNFLTHYFQALDTQIKAKGMSAIFGGKQPHQSGIITGGVTQVPPEAMRSQFRTLLDEVSTFVKNTYVKEVVGLGGGPLVSLALSDMGVGYKNYLSYGGYEEADGTYLFPEGGITDNVLRTTSRTVLEKYIKEDVTSSWYKVSGAGHPTVSDQEFDLNNNNAYTFVKSPRVYGYPMEVGPLARMMMAVKRTDHPTHNHPRVQDFIYYLGLGIRQGVIARHVARAFESEVLCDAMYGWLDELDAEIDGAGPSGPTIHDSAHWEPPASGVGIGMTEAARGSLGHWIKINNYVIDNYSCIVPTTWNASPKDEKGKIGPFEKALIGCTVPDTKNPINIGRIIRSFDPCLACAVHVIEPDGDVNEFKVNI